MRAPPPVGVSRSRGVAGAGAWPGAARATAAAEPFTNSAPSAARPLPRGASAQVRQGWGAPAGGSGPPPPPPHLPPPPRGHLRQAQPRPSGGLCHEGPVCASERGGATAAGMSEGFGAQPPPRFEAGLRAPRVPALSRRPWGPGGGGRAARGRGCGGRSRCVWPRRPRPRPQVAAPPAAPSPARGGRSGGGRSPEPFPSSLPPQSSRWPRAGAAAAPSPAAPGRGRAAIQHLGGRWASPRRRAGPGGRARPGWGCAATRDYFFVSQRCSWKKDL